MNKIACKQRLGLLAKACFCLFLMMTCYSNQVCAEKPNILIINTDVSIKRYQMAQQEFTLRLMSAGISTVTVNLATLKGTVAQIIARENPDLIYCIGSKAYLLTNQVDYGKHLVFSSMINWRRLPMSRLTYGVSNEISPKMQLFIYRYFFPQITKIGILYNKRYNHEWFNRALASSADVGIKIIGQTVEDPSQVENALEKLLPEIDALWLITDPIVLASRSSVHHLFHASNVLRKPVFTYSSAFLKYGAALIISADVPTIGGQVANLARTLLANEKSATAVQEPVGSHITLNLCELEKQGIAFNEDAFDSVNRIIHCQ